jgi:Phosphotransferase enzyme family
MVADGSGDLTREHLTERLRLCGTLPAARVTAVQVGESRKTILSTITSYRVEYSADAPPDAPTRMILKGSGSGCDPMLRRASELEVTFYRQAAPLTPAGLLPRCYDAEVTESGVRVLLEDLSDTHRIVTTWPLPPSVEVCERIVDTWAAFHGFWCRHPSLGHGVGTFLDEAALAAFGVERRQRYARFAEALDDGLPTRARELYDRLLDTLDRVVTPVFVYENCTLVHGDAHVWNLLYPRDGVASSIRLIDWASWRLGRGPLPRRAVRGRRQGVQPRAATARLSAGCPRRADDPGLAAIVWDSARCLVAPLEPPAGRGRRSRLRSAPVLTARRAGGQRTLRGGVGTGPAVFG